MELAEFGIPDFTLGKVLRGSSGTPRNTPGQLHRISMTQNGDPRDNPFAERVNGILKSEWLNDEAFLGFEDAYLRIGQVIEIYNTKRPHLSLNYQTPAQAYIQTGVQIKKWKNYYKSKNQEDEKNTILEMIQ